MSRQTQIVYNQLFTLVWIFV